MQIKIRHENEMKVFDLGRLDGLQLKNVELFLEKQKDELFEEFLQDKRRLHVDYLIESLMTSFERYREINDALRKIETFRFEQV